MKKIGIDARFYGYEGRGLGRYTEMLIKHLEQIDKKNKYYIFLRKNNFDLYQPKNKNFIKKLADVSWYSLKEQIMLTKIINKNPVDLMHFPHFNLPLAYKGKFVTTIHDLILLEYPTKKATTLNPFRYKIKEIGYRMVLKKAVLRSNKIISVSDFTKKDIIKHFPVAGNKVRVIYESCGKPKSKLKFNNQETQFVKKWGLNRPFLLYVGAAYPHKNLKRLLLAFRKIQKQGGENSRWKELSLVFVGGDDYFYKELKRFAGIKKIKNIKFLGLIKEESLLRCVYQKAQLFIFPSLYEGFGLPPLEAISEGVPTVCSKVTSIPEILGEAAYYFNPKNYNDMALKIMDVLKDPVLQRELIKKGKERLRKYSWKKMAAQTLMVYKEVLDKK